MNEQITPRAKISEQARAAARMADSGHEPVNPYTEGTEAHAVWQAAYVRYTTDIECFGARSA